MLGVGRDMPVARLADVVHAQEEVVAGRDAGRSIEIVLDAQQGHDVARPGLVDRGLHAREGADVDDHGGESGSHHDTQWWRDFHAAAILLNRSR